MFSRLLPCCLLATCAPSTTGAADPLPEAVPPPAWPAEGSVLRTLEAPRGGRGLAVFLDPGHGTGTNSGNDSCLCIEEQVHNLRVAEHLAASLTASGHRVVLARTDQAGPSYDERLQAATAASADLLLSLHSDARGEARHWSPIEGKTCAWNDENPGFSVLWSDEGEPAMIGGRRALAQALAARLAQAGFLPYDGHEYAGLYQGDPDHPGLFLDRHEPRRRIKMLRRPAMPSVIVETHDAWDRREEPRWQEEATLVAFDAAVATALADWEANQE